jgi:hypothetical protein
MYKSLPAEFVQYAKAAFIAKNSDFLTKIIFDRLVHSIFLERGNVPKTQHNLQDLGYIFH